jgi:long-chain acyl-CoA synthetase
MMQAPWLSHYPPGVPAEVDVHEFSSLNDVLARSCARFGPLPAFSNMGVSMRYVDLDRHSRAFAAYLQQVPTLSRGARVALMMPNLLQYPVALFGILRAGMVVVNVNPQYTAPELEHLLQDSGAGAVIVLENFAHTVQQVLERNPSMACTVFSTEIGDMFPTVKEVLTNLAVKYVKHMVPPWHIPNALEFNAALRAGRDLPFEDVAASHADLAFLQYTGGTTGTPKGVMLTHGNLVANLQQLSAWMANHLTEGAETLVCPLPLYHVYALTCSLVFLKMGAHNVLVTNPRDMHAFVGDLKRQPFSVIIGVNTLYRALLDAPEFAEVDTSRLKLANAGGMAVQRVVARRWKSVTGVPIVESYGLSETSPGALSNPLDIDEWSGDVGMPLPSTQATILDDEDREMAIGEVGEICLRGPQVMQGYWMRPEETRKAFTATGWLRTGDMGCMDERGSFRITDRKKDMIVVSGFKVFPNQIEDVIALHPGVAEVAAVGVPDEACGEVVKVIVVPTEPGLTEGVLLEHCRLHLTGYKVPKIVEFRNEPLPKTNLGKIMRRELRGASEAPVR